MIKAEGKIFNLHTRFEKDDEIGKMLSFLRFVGHPGDLSLFKANETFWEVRDGIKIMHGKMIPPISICNEKVVFRILQMICSQYASRFTCSPDEDRKMLLDSNLSFNKCNILTCRLEEKLVLNFFIQFCSVATGILSIIRPGGSRG